MIEVISLSAGYGKTEIIHNIDFKANSGEITTIIGNNGCGKSTFLKAVSGIIPILHGDIKVDDNSVTQLSHAERAKLTAYLPQGKNTPDITAERMVLHGRFPYLSYPRKYKNSDYEIARKAMEKMCISELTDTPLSMLSGGTRQKVYIAMILAQSSPVIVMDEPTSYLDIGQQMNFIRIIKELVNDGKTIILVLHDILTALKISDSICVMDNGQVVIQETPDKILKSGIIKEIYGIEVGILNTTEGEQYYYRM